MKIDLLLCATLLSALGACTKGTTDIGDLDDTGSSTAAPGDDSGSSSTAAPGTSEDSGSTAPGLESSSTGTGSDCQAPGEGCDPEACQSYEEGIQRATLEGDVCSCSNEQRCLTWPEGAGIGGSGAPGCYFDARTGEVAAHSTIWIDLPEGWTHCGDAGSPPACACCTDARGCVAG